MSYLKNIGKFIAVNLLPEDLFRRDISVESAKKLFCDYVEIVEIENHNYCNRTCWFCPNLKYDRLSKVVLLPDKIFKKIIDNLAEINYSQTLVWSRYHEPLAHDSIIMRLNQARNKLPKATLTFISNGDYLSAAIVRSLEENGLDRLMLDLYLQEGKERDKAEIERALNQFIERTGLSLEKMQGKPYDYEVKGSTIQITMGVPNYQGKSLSSRGGLIDHPDLQDYQRTAICVAPIHSVVIDYTGHAMLCCQVRSDAPEHKKAIIGNLNDEFYTLFDFYRDLADSRRGLISGGPKSGVCEKCNVSADTPEYVSRSKFFYFILKNTPGFKKGFQYFHRRRRATTRWHKKS